MTRMMISSLCKTSQLLRSVASSSIQCRCIGTAVGDKIPINFMKDGKDPVILEDKDYPAYVLTLTDPLPTKTQLLKLIKEAGGMDGDLTVLGIRNIKRAKRLMGLELVRANNMSTVK